MVVVFLYSPRSPLKAKPKNFSQTSLLQSWAVVCNPYSQTAHLSRIPRTELDLSLELGRQQRLAVVICNVARALWSSKTAYIGGKENSLYEEEIALYVESIQLDPNCASAYSAVAAALLVADPSEGKVFEVAGIGSVTPLELLLTAMELDPNHPSVLNNLAFLARSGHSVVLRNGQTLTRRDLLIKAVQLADDSAASLNNLADTMTNNELVHVGGKFLSRRDLYLKAIEIAPKESATYNRLASILSATEIVTLLDGQAMSRHDLYLKVIDLDPQSSVGYNNLATITPADSEAVLLDGRTMTVTQLRLHALHYRKTMDSIKVALLYRLAAACPFGETLQLLSGEHLSRQDFCLRAIDLDPFDTRSIRLLAGTAPEGSSVTLLNGRKFTRLELYYRSFGCGISSKDRRAVFRYAVGDFST